MYFFNCTEQNIYFTKYNNRFKLIKFGMKVSTHDQSLQESESAHMQQHKLYGRFVLQCGKSLLLYSIISQLLLEIPILFPTLAMHPSLRRTFRAREGNRTRDEDQGALSIRWWFRIFKFVIMTGQNNGDNDRRKKLERDLEWSKTNWVDPIWVCLSSKTK